MDNLTISSEGRSDRRTETSRTDDGNESNRLALPDFLCPSSEDKSKGYECKLWVAKHHFLSAIRTIPLV